MIPIAKPAYELAKIDRTLYNKNQQKVLENLK